MYYNLRMFTKNKFSLNAAENMNIQPCQIKKDEEYYNLDDSDVGGGK